jgi:hypothetical protein
MARSLKVKGVQDVPFVQVLFPIKEIPPRGSSEEKYVGAVVTEEFISVWQVIPRS